MSSKQRHPKWWQLYIMLPLLVGLFWQEMQAPFTETGHVIAQLGILFLIFGFVQLWMRANRSALMYMDEDEGQWRIHIYQVPPAQVRSLDDAEGRPKERPMFQIPASDLKGALDEPFAWEIPEEEPAVLADHGAAARKE
jgi:hypothetical protein